jgi:hypothetical protein
MDIKQDQAFKRLLKKLSALRATLKNDERSLLDGLVIGSADEVEAHSLATRPTPRPSAGADEVKTHSLTARPTPRPTPRPSAGADEVKTHSLTARPTPRPTPRPSAGADEVKTHSLTARPTPRPTPRPSAGADEVEAHSMKNERPNVERVNLRVAFDADKEEYRPIP